MRNSVALHPIIISVFGHEPKMSLLTELKNKFLVFVLQRCRADGVLMRHLIAPHGYSTSSSALVKQTIVMSYDYRCNINNIFEHVGDLIHEQEKNRVKQAGMFLHPQQRAFGYKTFDGFLIGQETDTNTNGCSGQYISRIMNTQINPRQANKEYRVQQGNPSQDTGNKEEAGCKRKEHDRVITWKGAPILPVHERLRGEV
jgi:hypothetical protein